MLDTDKIPNNKTLRDVNEIQNLHNCIILRRDNPRRITLPLILKLRSMILSNIKGEPETLTRENEIVIRRLVTAYYKNIEQGYHSFEQMILWYQAFRHLKPFKIGTNRVAGEIVHYMMMAIGYPRTFQTSNQVMKESVVFADLDLGKKHPHPHRKIHRRKNTHTRSRHPPEDHRKMGPAQKQTPETAGPLSPPGNITPQLCPGLQHHQMQRHRTTHHAQNQDHQRLADKHHRNP